MVGVRLWFWEEQVRNSLFIWQIFVEHLLCVQVLPYDLGRQPGSHDGAIPLEKMKTLSNVSPQILQKGFPGSTEQRLLYLKILWIILGKEELLTHLILSGVSDSGATDFLP